MRPLEAPAPPLDLPLAGLDGRAVLRRGDVAGLDHEQVVIERGSRSGALMAVAIHSTLLGPALGGARMWHYERERDAVDDVLRLARAMTFKAAVAGLDLGGGKGVICTGPAAPAGTEREAMLLDFGDLVASLRGRYITAEDVGTGAPDMVTIARRTRYVTGLPVELGGAGDPSPFTALGVEAAMRAACRHALGGRLLSGRRIVIVGVGHVGARLARGLAESGARLVLSDIDPRRAELARELGAGWAAPDEALVAECDVLAPCAVGGAIHGGNVDELRCRVVCGAANNALADEALAERLRERAILYAPDFVANAGGLISVYRELRAYDERRARELALGIERTMDAVLAAAAERGVTPLAAARELALERLESAR